MISRKSEMMKHRYPFIGTTERRGLFQFEWSPQKAVIVFQYFIMFPLDIVENYECFFFNLMPCLFPCHVGLHVFSVAWTNNLCILWHTILYIIVYCETELYIWNKERCGRLAKPPWHDFLFFRTRCKIIKMGHYILCKE